MARTPWRFISGVGLVLVVLLAAPVRAQRGPEEVFQRSLFFEQDVRQRLEAVVPPVQPALVEWGGFYSPSYYFYDDIDDGEAHLARQDLRLWTQIRVDEVHRIFARMRLDYYHFAEGDAHGFRQHDLEGPNLEVGYYDLDLARAFEKYFGQKWPVGVTLRGGRQYVEVGRGIALGKVLDIGRVDVHTKHVSWMGFAGRTVPGEDNIDRSAPGFTRSRRTFYGTEVRYHGLTGHEPYAFYVYQHDWSSEAAVDPFQDYLYHSGYYGGGSRGSLLRDLRYEVELLGQFGRSVAHGQRGHFESIRAWAFDAELAYYVKHVLKPVFSFEYAYASGDSDRRSATTALFGNRAGTNDHAFQGFGYVNSGLAMAARFTNLQFVRLGARLTPYEQKQRLGRVDVGADYYFLFRAEADGPGSDARATRSSADLGQEVDLYLEWRILSDLSWTIRYGRFLPGNAYPSGSETRDFLYTGLNVSF